MQAFFLALIKTLWVWLSEAFAVLLFCWKLTEMTGLEDLKDLWINQGRLRPIALKDLGSEETSGWLAIKRAVAKLCPARDQVLQRANSASLTINATLFKKQHFFVKTKANYNFIMKVKKCWKFQFYETWLWLGKHCKQRLKRLKQNPIKTAIKTK